MPAAKGMACGAGDSSSATVMRNIGSPPAATAGSDSAASSLAASGVRETCTTCPGWWPNF